MTRFVQLESLENRRLLAAAVPLFPTETGPAGPSQTVSYDGNVWFTSSGYQAQYLYRSDGTAAGTENTSATLPMLQTANFNPAEGMPVVAAGKLFLRVGSALWATDGTAAGTLKLADKTAGITGSFGVVYNDRFYFTAVTGTQEVGYVSDGTVAGTSVWTTDSFNGLGPIGMVGNRTYYSYAAGTTAYSLRFVENQAATALLTVPGAPLSVQHFRGNQKLIYVRTAGSGRLWVTDDTSLGTRPLDTPLNVLAPPAVFQGIAYFLATTDNGAMNIYRTDGTLAGTYAITEPGTYDTYSAKTMPSAIFADRLYLGAGTHRTLVIDSTGRIDTLVAAATAVPTTGFNVDGDRLWFGTTARYVDAAAPTTAVDTDGRVAPVGTGDGKYVGLQQVGGSSTQVLHVWDSTQPYYGTLGGTAYNDVNGDGVFDGVGSYLRDRVRVYVDINDNGAFDDNEPFAETSSSGQFSIKNVPAGTYAVAVAAEPGVVAPSFSPRVTVMPGVNLAIPNVLASFGGRLAGVLFADTNGNGVQDAGEYGLSGRQVYLVPSPDATPVAGDPVATTDSAGRYLFANVAGTSGYLKVTTGTARYRRTTADTPVGVPAGTVGVINGPAVGLQAPGTVRLDYAVDLAGSSVPAAFSVGVYADLDQDGVYDPGEPAGVVADEGTLTNLPAGPVVIRLLPPQGWQTSLDGDAVVVDVPSGAPVATPPFRLVPDAVQTGNAVLSGVVAEDTNFNGVVDTADAPAAQATLYDDANNNATRDFGEAYAAANALGEYAFTTLPAGARTLRLGTGGPFVTRAGVMPITVTPGVGVRADVPAYHTARAVRLSGQVRFDANNNGIVDETDPPLKGVSLTPPVLNVSTVTVSPRTDAAGRFVSLLPTGTYRPAVAYLPGYTLVGTTPSVTLTTGQTADDFVLLLKGPTAALGSVSGRVFRDDNADGTQEAGEPPLAGIDLYADTNSNGFADFNEQRVRTLADGSYSFAGLSVAHTTIRLLGAQAGTFITNNGPAINSVMVSVNGTDVTDVNIGYQQRAIVSGYVFRDYDRDGTRAATETGKAGAVVWADLNADAQRDADEPYVYPSSTGYTLFVPPAQTFTVYVDLPAGQTATTATSAVITSGAAGTTKSFSVGVLDGTNQIGGRAYFDRNQNGTLDPNEPAGGGSVKLLNPATGATVATSTIGTDYAYRFPGVAAGTYRVVYTPPAGYEGRENAAGATVTVGTDENLTAANFGYFPPPIAFTGRVMRDNGVAGPDASDAPVAGVRAFADVNENNRYDAGDYAALTDATGAFTITGIQYIYGKNYPSHLIIQNPSGMRRTSPYVSWDYISLSPQTGLDAGTHLFAPPKGPAAVGYVYKDLNTNGQRDPGEPGIPNYQVGSSFGSPSFDGVVTDHEGLYVFTGSSNGGGYALRANLGQQWIPTDPVFGGSKSVVIPQNTVVTGPDFGFVDFQIGGRTFVDTNANGRLDDAETPVAGRRVWIDANANGQFDTGERDTLSDADGYFAFASTGGGTFRLAQDKPAEEPGEAGVVVTVPTGGATGGVTFAGPAAVADPATFVIDDGTGQRSRVRTVAVTVDADVVAAGIGAGAFVLARAGATQAVEWAVQSVVATLGNKTTITLAFPGSPGGSLADGRYTLTVDGSRLTDTAGRRVDVAGNGTAGSTASTSFFRLFADVDANAKIDFTDFLYLQSHFNQTVGPIGREGALDGDGNGKIDFNDFLMLQANFGKDRLSDAD